MKLQVSCASYHGNCTTRASDWPKIPQISCMRSQNAHAHKWMQRDALGPGRPVKKLALLPVISLTSSSCTAQLSSSRDPENTSSLSFILLAFPPFASFFLPSGKLAIVRCICFYALISSLLSVWRHGASYCVYTYMYLKTVLIYICMRTRICRHQERTMASSLEQLKKFTTVVADTGDIKRM